jgi:hypothetical protein
MPLYLERLESRAVTICFPLRLVDLWVIARCEGLRYLAIKQISDMLSLSNDKE